MKDPWSDWIEDIFGALLFFCLAWIVIIVMGVL